MYNAFRVPPLSSADVANELVLYLVPRAFHGVAFTFTATN